jgi:hypothetical protein
MRCTADAAAIADADAGGKFTIAVSLKNEYNIAIAPAVAIFIL